MMKERKGNSKHFFIRWKSTKETFCNKLLDIPTQIIESSVKRSLLQDPSPAEYPLQSSERCRRSY